MPSALPPLLPSTPSAPTAPAGVALTLVGMLAEVGPAGQTCVTTKTRHVNGLGQLSELEQEGNTESQQESNTESYGQTFRAPLCYSRDTAFQLGALEQDSNTDSHSARNTNSEQERNTDSRSALQSNEREHRRNHPRRHQANRRRQANMRAPSPAACPGEGHMRVAPSLPSCHLQHRKCPRHLTTKGFHQKHANVGTYMWRAGVAASAQGAPQTDDRRWRRQKGASMSRCLSSNSAANRRPVLAAPEGGDQ